MYEYGLLNAGRWMEGEGGQFETRNPARPDEVVGRYTIPSARQIDAVLASAQAAQGSWRRVPGIERATLFGRFLDALAGRADALARSITLEQGKPLAESRNEVAKSIAEGRAMAAAAASDAGDVRPSARRGIRNLVTRRPRGVIAAITPWNFPILTPLRKLSPAVVFGNAIVLKPSEYAPATASLVAEAAKDILPDGLVQVVHGGADIGSAIVAHPGVAGVTFTGSVATGRRIYALAAQNLAEISLELGGKNAAVIHDAPVLDACLDQVMLAACMCAGQRCTAVSRVIVRRTLHDDVISGLVARAQAFRLGDGLLDGTTMGPLTNARQLASVGKHVEEGIRAGARIATGGGALSIDGCAGGYFFAPTVLADVRVDNPVAREEIFGPVISVLAYDSAGRGVRDPQWRRIWTHVFAVLAGRWCHPAFRRRERERHAAHQPRHHS